MSKDTFSEVDDPHGHIERMLTTTVLNRFRRDTMAVGEDVFFTGVTTLAPVLFLVALLFGDMIVK